MSANARTLYTYECDYAPAHMRWRAQWVDPDDGVADDERMPDHGEGETEWLAVRDLMENHELPECSDGG